VPLFNGSGVGGAVPWIPPAPLQDGASHERTRDAVARGASAACSFLQGNFPNRLISCARSTPFFLVLHRLPVHRWRH
jgi:hypothetical protein